MMKLFVTLLVLVLLLLGVSFLLPPAYEVSRSVVINAPSERIHAHVNDLRAWKQWGIWYERDPAMQCEYSEPASGADAFMSWESESEGQGKLTLTSSDPAKGIWMDLAFEQGKYISKGAITYEAVDEGTRVTWINRGDLSDPVARYMGLLFDRMMGPDFATNLSRLKDVVEKTPAG